MLTCPFCRCPLIAIKGKTKAAHFRHDGETCNESLNEIPQIPAWHHFPRTAKEELFKRDDWTDNLMFTDTSRVILGSLSLQRFSQWMRSTLQSRIQTLRDAVAQETKHRAWLEIEAHRQQSILTASLYLFEYQLDDKTIIHKVGRTSREPEQRLKETALALEKATKINVVWF